VAAAFVSDRGEVHTCRFGESMRLTVNDFVFDVDPNAFFQSNRPLLGDFMREVLDQAGASPKYVLDLFCGSGFFSIPLAKRSVEVIGVESSGVAIRKARLNATLNQTTNVEFVKGQVHVALRGASLRPDLVVLNPPRAGCGAEAARDVG